VSCCHIFSARCILIRVSTPLSDMSDDLFTASAHSNARFITGLTLYDIVVVNDILLYSCCCFNYMLSIGCNPNL
jgi:hypothetical protein